MIVDEQLLLDSLAFWLAEYAHKYGKKLFVTNNKGTRQDQLVSYLCKEATKFHSAKTYNYQHPPSSNTDGFAECHIYASQENGIVVGSIDRTYGLYYREYNKIGAGIADVFPLFDIEYSEIVQLYEFLWKGKFKYDDPPGYQMIEFCNYAEVTYGIITDEQPPHTHRRWPYFTQGQKEFIAIVHQREKKTRHKILNRPYYLISNKAHLCTRSAP